MLAHSDPATFVVLVLLILLALTAWRLQVSRARRREGRRRLAVATGHPSTFQRDVLDLPHGQPISKRVPSPG